MGFISPWGGPKLIFLPQIMSSVISKNVLKYGKKIMIAIPTA